MNSDLNAVYEGGAFWPLKDQNVTVPEGEVVRLIVQATNRGTNNDVLNLAAKVYQGLSQAEISDVERVALDRDNFFTKKSEN